MNLLKKPLPGVLGPDTTVHEPGIHGRDMENLPDGAASFIRPVDIAIEAPGAKMLVAYPHLNEVLERTDEELAKIAKLCGAQVVGHTWHLIEPLQAHGQRLQEALAEDFGAYRRMGIPRGKALAARVDLIEHVEPMDDATAASVEEGINSYYAEYDALCDDSELESFRGAILSAVDGEQFVTGIRAGDPPEAPRGLWLPDIEPRLIWAA